ncbi:MAG: hypothetical protein R3F02_09400 [Thiolinea sp.]
MVLERFPLNNDRDRKAMKIKTQLTLAAVITAGLLASGCSQQMVAQQSAEAAPVVQEPVVKTIVDCSKCAKPTPKPRPAAKKCWHGRNAKGQCNPAPRMRMAPRTEAPVVPQVAPRTVVQQPIPRAKRCWHGRNAKGQCNPRPRMNVVQRPVAPMPNYQQMATPKAQPNYQQMATPKIQPKGNFRGAIEIDGVMQQYQN